MTAKFPMYLGYNDLQLGDVIQLGADGPFCTGTVTGIEGDEITLHRPYGATSDFSCPNLIHYTGLEIVKIFKASDAKNAPTVKVWQRKNIR